MQDVVDFIKHFKGSEEVFLNGCCYWFARILQDRFHEHGYLVDIYHDPVEGHFLARFIEDSGYKWMHPETYHNPPEVHFFDIRGDVTELYNEDDLENLWLMEQNEERRWGRLMCDCREFILPENYPAWLKQ